MDPGFRRDDNNMDPGFRRDDGEANYPPSTIHLHYPLSTIHYPLSPMQGLNERSGNRPVDLLINTHHHGDHTGGNIAFRGNAKKVVAHAKAAEHMKMPPGAQPPADQLYPDTTFAE